MLNELYTFAEPVQVVPFSNLKWGKFTLLHTPGELKVVAYDENGRPVAEKVTRTAGRPHHIEIVSGLAFTGDDRMPSLKADGKDLAYLTVKVVDRQGNLCPTYSGLLEFQASGSASYRASANGDPTCLDIFHEPRMHAFGGMLTVILQAGDTPGKAVLKVKGKGVREGVAELPVTP